MARMTRSKTQRAGADDDAGAIALEDVDDPAVLAVANHRHPLNVGITEYEWQRALEQARVEGGESVSDIVRKALTKYLDAVSYTHLTLPTIYSV